MTDSITQPRATFTSFQESTQEDWELIMSQRGALSQSLPTRILQQLELLRNDYGGFPVDRLEHSVQTATRAECGAYASSPVASVSGASDTFLYLIP